LSIQKEFLRQLIHLSGLLFIFLENLIPLSFLIGIAFCITVIGELIYQIDKKKHMPIFSNILRNCRRDKNERGFVYFFAGITMAMIVFGHNLMVMNAAIIILTLGDSFSTLVGTKWGKHQLIFNSKKTWEGSLTFLIIAFLGALTQIEPITAMIGAISGAISEAYSPIDDNLTIALISGTLMSIFIFIT
jgi:dolichol kinase